MQVLDLPVALMLTALGIAFIAVQGRLDAVRKERVRRGEISVEQARKIKKLSYWCSHLITVCGLSLLGMWAIGHWRQR
jgi:hypothetical protein